MTVAAEDPFTLAPKADPYPGYAWLRRHDPVHFDPHTQRWFLARYADVDAFLRDPSPLADRASQLIERRRPEVREELRPLGRVLGKQMLFADPPDHMRIRGLVTKAFTPRAIEQMRPRIEQLVETMLDRLAPAGEMDLIRDFAHPLPAGVMCDMLGISADEMEGYKHWSSGLAGFLGNLTADPEVDRRAVLAVAEATSCFQTVASTLRASPRDDLMSNLVAAEEQGDRLSVEELLANAVLLLSAGHETTTNLIGNGLLALFRHPYQEARLRADAGLIPAAVEEFLRYDSPVQTTARIARNDLKIGRQVIPPGAYVVTLIGAANRDPDQFPDPDRLDVGRHPNRHLAFGQGSHFCIGAPLARLEGHVAITALLRRFPRLRLATDQVTWQPNISFRGLTALPVAWT